jgi:DNA-binding NtrC family response regulator
LIAEADEGTLFLDELSSLSQRGQSKLLRVLETGAVRRVGESRTRSIGFRLVATAQERLSAMMRDGLFRHDLAQRVAGIVVRLPSLRDRGDDVVHLARYFAELEGAFLDDGAAIMLAHRDWPGNVRELKWMVARCALFATDDVIDVNAVRAAMEIGLAQLSHCHDSAPPSDGLVELRTICQEHEGDPDQVARALGIGRSTLYRRLKRVGLRLESFRNATLQV